MKLLFDQNLSRKLPLRLADIFSSSMHVITLGAERAADVDIWRIAKTEDYVIITKDDDFRQRAFLYGHPPKVILLTLGNCTTDLVEQTIRAHIEEINEFELDGSALLLIPDSCYQASDFMSSTNSRTSASVVSHAHMKREPAPMKS